MWKNQGKTNDHGITLTTEWTLTKHPRPIDQKQQIFAKNCQNCLKWLKPILGPIHSLLVFTWGQMKAKNKFQLTLGSLLGPRIWNFKIFMPFTQSGITLVFFKLQSSVLPFWNRKAKGYPWHLSIKHIMSLNVIKCQ